MEWSVMHLLQNPVTLVFMIPISAIVVGGLSAMVITVTRMVIRHRERMALIEHGMDPRIAGEDRGEDAD